MRSCPWSLRSSAATEESIPDTKKGLYQYLLYCNAQLTYHTSLIPPDIATAIVAKELADPDPDLNPDLYLPR